MTDNFAITIFTCHYSGINTETNQRACLDGIIGMPVRISLPLLQKTDSDISAKLKTDVCNIRQLVPSPMFYGMKSNTMKKNGVQLG